jgi:hypothetical protein
MLGYRGSEYSAPRNISAADILRYEMQELGNTFCISDDLWGFMETIPASAVIWVCDTPEAAVRYTEDEDIEQVETIDLGDNPTILAIDGDAGALVYVPEWRR